MSPFDEELKPFETLARDFARKELLKEREKHDKFPFGPFFDDVLNKAHDVGFLRIMLPVEGGTGRGVSALCTILENICQVDSSLGGIIFVNSLSQELMRAACGGDKAGEILGDAKSAADCLVAFQAFNNPSEIKNPIMVRKKDGAFLVSGSLEYLVLGGIAKRGILPAMTEGEDGYSYFLVDLSSEGVEKSGPVFSLGFHACPAVDVKFIDSRGILLGEIGKGEYYFQQAAARMHVAAAAISAGIMKGSFDEALGYMNERSQGGRRIVDWSALRMMLADMAVGIQIADMTLATACQLVDNAQNGWELCSRSAAIHIQEMACEAVTDGVQLLGGYGYMKDYGQEKRFRDAKQAQALLGMAPLRKLKLIEEIINSK